MGRVGPLELILILVALLLLFGARRIPEIARSLGRAISQFRRGMRDSMSDNNENNSDTEDRNE
ncbi:MAG: twin-arginine translocase TatA/TatE family subunit [Candidatus Fermentibacteraceae bacterium]